MKPFTREILAMVKQQPFTSTIASASLAYYVFRTSSFSASSPTVIPLLEYNHYLLK